MTKGDDSLCILVVEDNKGDFILIEDYLNEVFINPLISHTISLKETELTLNNTRFDVILLDLNLPDASGPELIAKMLEISSGTPLIILTGYQDKDFGIKTISMGTSDYLFKDELNPSLLSKSIVYNIERKRVNEKLIHSEKKYRDLFQLSPLPMWVYDLVTLKFLDVNNAALKQYGYTKEEFLSLTIEHLHMPEARDKLFSDIEKLKKKELPGREGIVRHKTKTGELLTVEINSNIIDYNGNPAELVLSIDITPEIEKEEKLEKTNKRLENAESIARLGYWEHDIKNNTMFWSDEFYRILEINENGTKPSIEKFINLLHPDERASFSDYYSFTINNHSEMEVEHRILCPTGKIKYIYGKGNCVVTEKNEVIFEGIFLDITKRKEEESLLRLQESVITNSSDSIIIMEVNPVIRQKPKIIFANEAFTNMSGYSQGEVMGKPISIMYGTKTNKKELNKLSEAMESRKPCEIEVINYKKDGTSFWTNIYMAPVSDKSGTLTHWVSIQRDVTERKHYVKNLEMHNTKLRDIAWTQSHVVRAPVARIMGLINLINRMYGELIPEKRLLTDLEKSTMELDVIIRKIVRLAESANTNLKK